MLRAPDPLAVKILPGYPRFLPEPSKLRLLRVPQRELPLTGWEGSKCARNQHQRLPERQSLKRLVRCQIALPSMKPPKRP